MNPFLSTFFATYRVRLVSPRTSNQAENKWFMWNKCWNRHRLWWDLNHGISPKTPWNSTSSEAVVVPLRIALWRWRKLQRMILFCCNQFGRFGAHRGGHFSFFLSFFLSCVSLCFISVDGTTMCLQTVVAGEVISIELLFAESLSFCILLCKHIQSITVTNIDATNQW
jgi:hypothetical protein